VAQKVANRNKIQLEEENEVQFQRETRQACLASAHLAQHSSKFEAENGEIDKSRAHKVQFTDRLHDFFEQSNMKREICACCFEKVKKKNIHVVPDNETTRGQWIKRLTNRLCWGHVIGTVSDRTKMYYDASKKAPELAGLPLAPSGVKYADETWQVRFLNKILFAQSTVLPIIPNKQIICILAFD
jgi:hypothetical protein